MNQAERNESVFLHLSAWDSVAGRQWAVITLFYIALHWVEAFYALRGWHNDNHERRDVNMSRTPDLSQIIDSYRLLRIDSENIRYDGSPVRDATVAQAFSYYTKLVQNLKPRLGL